ncbi:hypothetical protein GV64_12760 [Endozoicomonas elysicola]|uniref:Uncharacterized protein n=1 Tax=Endozoicomonas elysicola TaxID=305900 RepID=A0A081KBH3_9GAMM|nr:hypothetical protein GV64_12760 [Endozoicomonas elysicola]
MEKYGVFRQEPITAQTLIISYSIKVRGIKLLMPRTKVTDRIVSTAGLSLNEKMKASKYSQSIVCEYFEGFPANLSFRKNSFLKTKGALR